MADMGSICGTQRVIEVGDDVVDVLDSDAQPDHLAPYAGLFLDTATALVLGSTS